MKLFGSVKVKYFRNWNKEAQTVCTTNMWLVRSWCHVFILNRKLHLKGIFSSTQARAVKPVCVWNNSLCVPVTSKGVFNIYIIFKSFDFTVTSPWLSKHLRSLLTATLRKARFKSGCVSQLMVGETSAPDWDQSRCANTSGSFQGKHKAVGQERQTLCSQGLHVEAIRGDKKRGCVCSQSRKCWNKCSSSETSSKVRDRQQLRGRRHSRDSTQAKCLLSPFCTGRHISQRACTTVQRWHVRLTWIHWNDSATCSQGSETSPLSEQRAGRSGYDH